MWFSNKIYDTIREYCKAVFLFFVKMAMEHLDVEQTVEHILEAYVARNKNGNFA